MLFSRSKKHRLLAAILVAIAIFVAFCTLQSTTPNRPLGPKDLGTLLASGIEKASAITVDGTPFRIAIDADERLLSRRLTFDQLGTSTAALQAVSLENSKLLVDAFWLPFAVDGTLHACALLLDVGPYKADPVSCDQIKDQQFIRFQFSERIVPGIYQANLRIDQAQPVAKIFPLAARAKVPGEWWLLADTRPNRLSLAAALAAVAEFSPWRVIGYCIGTLLVLTAILIGRGLSRDYAVVLLGVIGTVMAVSWPFSGHDETAHLDMLHAALHPNLADAERQEFYRTTSQYIVDSNFYRLHTSEFADADECPHSVLYAQQCGHSPKPRWLYQWYARLLPPSHAPADLIAYGRIINVILVTLVLITILLLLGNAGVAASIACLLLAGFTWSQIASITNDFPVTLFGLYVGCSLATLLSDVSNIRRALLMLAWMGLLPITMQVDFSWLSLCGMIPAYVLIGTVTLGRSLHVRPTRLALITSIIFVSGFAILALLLTNPTWLHPIAPKKVHAVFMQPFAWSEMVTSFFHLRIFMKSIFGSFLWGHAYYPGWLNSVIIAFLVFSLIFSLLLPKDSLYRKLAYFASYASIAVCLIVLLVFLARYFPSETLGADAFAKPRFLAACWAGLFLPVWKLVYDSYRVNLARRIFFISISSIAAIALLVALPKIFFFGIL